MATLLSSFVIGSTDTNSVALTNDAKSAISYGARKIIAHTSLNEMLLFLGNSASYFYYAVRKTGKREAHLIPVSGRYTLDEEDKRYSDSHFIETYVTPVVTRALTENRVIVLIDHTHSGITVDNFVSVLDSRCNGRCKLALINLVAEAQVLGHSIRPPRKVGTRYEVVLPNVGVELFNEHFFRLTPHHPRSKWHLSNPNLITEHQSKDPRRKETIRDIEEMDI